MCLCVSVSLWQHVCLYVGVLVKMCVTCVYVMLRVFVSVHMFEYRPRGGKPIGILSCWAPTSGDSADQRAINACVSRITSAGVAAGFCNFHWCNIVFLQETSTRFTPRARFSCMCVWATCTPAANKSSLDSLNGFLPPREQRTATRRPRLPRGGAGWGSAHLKSHAGSVLGLKSQTALGIAFVAGWSGRLKSQTRWRL